MNTGNSSGPKPKPVVLITGYRGLAETLISEFHHDYHVSSLVRDQAMLGELKTKFPTVLFVHGDVVNGADGKNWVEQSVLQFGTVDCLINNAAVTGPGGPLNDISFMDFRLAIDINLLAPVRLTKFVLPYFLKQKSGVVINLSGGGATQGRPNFSAYATAKCALVRFTECVALEYPELSFYSISPGALKTPMIEKVAQMNPKSIGAEHQEALNRQETGGDDPKKAATLARWLVENRPPHLNGSLVSAIWDNYQNSKDLPHQAGWWKLRRVDAVLTENLQALN